MRTERASPGHPPPPSRTDGEAENPGPRDAESVELQWADLSEEQRAEIARSYGLTCDPETYWGGALVWMCRVHILIGWIYHAFETIWDVD